MKQHKKERKKILILNGGPTTRYFLKMHLNKAGYDTLAFPDTVRALETLKRDKIDLIISDVFNIGNGCSEDYFYEFIEKLNEHGALPVLVCSSPFLKYQEERCRYNGKIENIDTLDLGTEGLVKKVRETLPEKVEAS